MIFVTLTTTRRLSSFLLPQIDWDNRFLSGNGLRRRCEVFVTVDGTDFRIKDPSPFSTSWYSHKYKGPGVRYEVAICIATGWIVWFSGPYRCGSWPDLSIARDGLHFMLEDGERYIADGGYKCEEALIPDDAVTFYERYYMSSARARHETINQLFKQWKIIGNRFSRDPSKHGLFAHSIANIVQLGFMVEESFPYHVGDIPEPPTWPNW